MGALPSRMERHEPPAQPTMITKVPTLSVPMGRRPRSRLNAPANLLILIKHILNLERLDLNIDMRVKNRVPHKKDRVELSQLVKVMLHMPVPTLCYAIQLLRLPSKVEKELVAGLDSYDDLDRALDLCATVSSQLHKRCDAPYLNSLEVSTTYGKSLAEVTWSHAHAAKTVGKNVSRSRCDALARSC